jgi:WhiB family redox-sensing transcriptional regulator
MMRGAYPYDPTMAYRPARTRPGPWTQHAKCVGSNPDLFYPGRGDNRTVHAAKTICHACPVRSECADHALTNGEKYGVWGGLSELDRRRVRGHKRWVA